ncbi:hypothetical protein VTI74DRAFT_6026 [Chaetomium olivicolor]
MGVRHGVTHTRSGRTRSRLLPMLSLLSKGRRKSNSVPAQPSPLFLRKLGPFCLALLWLWRSPSPHRTRSPTTSGFRHCERFTASRRAVQWARASNPIPGGHRCLSALIPIVSERHHPRPTLPETRHDATTSMKPRLTHSLRPPSAMAGSRQRQRMLPGGLGPFIQPCRFESRALRMINFVFKRRPAKSALGKSGEKRPLEAASPARVLVAVAANRGRALAGLRSSHGRRVAVRQPIAR